MEAYYTSNSTFTYICTVYAPITEFDSALLDIERDSYDILQAFKKNDIDTALTKTAITMNIDNIIKNYTLGKTF